MIPPPHGDAEPRASWRILSTPLGDLLRRRITGPRPPRHLRGWRGVVASSDLPAGLRDTIGAIATSLRLWREEKSDVARELAAHFADGLASGATAESLRDSFGDPQQAARLITRAKKRTRPMWWHAQRRALQGIAAILLVAVLGYGYLAARFWLFSPRIAHNYWADLDAPTLAHMEAERAWPRYLDALTSLEKLPQNLWNGWGIYRPGDPEWPEVVAYLTRNQDAIAAIRDAAARPVFGYQFSDRKQERLSTVYRAQNPEFTSFDARPPSENPPVLEVLMPYLGEMRKLARVLSMDTFAAAERRDSARIVQNTAALVGMSSQLSREPFFIGRLVGLAILRVASSDIAAILENSPTAISEKDLVTIAHTLASCEDPPLPFATERLFLVDFLQRLYTDDGKGDGHLTADGYRLLTDFANITAPSNPDLDALESTVGPVHAAVIAGRRDTQAEYDRLIALMRQSREKPMWEWDDRAANAEIERISKRRYIVATVLLPAGEQVLESRQKQLQFRDTTLIAIALELYHRAHGSYPDALGALVPDLLPALPPDGIDGRPMRYALRDGRPVVYSVGLDRDDDSGRQPLAGPMNDFRWTSAAEVRQKLSSAPEKYDGDVVYWPPQPRPEITRDEPSPAG